LKSEPNQKPHVAHTIHGLAFHPYLNKLLNKFYIAIEKATEKKTDAFLCVADAMTEKTIAAGIGKPEDFTTAYSAIDEDDFLTKPSDEEIADFRRKHDISAHAKVFVCIARLAELKGHDFIIESAKRLTKDHSECVWLFVGDGHLTDQIISIVQIAGLGYKFKFAGLLSPDQIPLAIHSSDVLVHCSLREGLARVLPQAMLCGKPVVSFDIDGAKEVVNENTGFLIEPENIDQLTEACEKLIDDPEMAARLGQNARQSVTQQFAPDTMVDVIEKVYEKLIQ
jgi:glycosyltransferase involved in cell wall biosynthesis